MGYQQRYGNGTGRCTSPYRRLANPGRVRTNHQKWYENGTGVPRTIQTANQVRVLRSAFRLAAGLVRLTKKVCDVVDDRRGMHLCWMWRKRVERQRKSFPSDVEIFHICNGGRYDESAEKVVSWIGICEKV